MSYKLAIFDYDGTLADSGAWMARALNKCAVKFGFRQLNESEIEALRGKDNRAILREVGVPLWKLPQIAAYVRKMAIEENVVTPLFPGVREALPRLRAGGVRLAIVSSNSEDIIRRSLGPALSAEIDFFACDASLFGKAPKIKRVVKRAGVTSGEAIAIGDETRDIEAARAAGIACAAVSWGYATAALLKAHAPDLIFASVAEMVETLSPNP
jgi:phosphoglycolate phosphatase